MESSEIVSDGATHELIAWARWVCDWWPYPGEHTEAI